MRLARMDILPAPGRRGYAPYAGASRSKHLPRYLREWSYRFNRRNRVDGLDRYLIRGAMESATITYEQLIAGGMPGGAVRTRRRPPLVALPVLAG